MSHEQNGWLLLAHSISMHQSLRKRETSLSPPPCKPDKVSATMVIIPKRQNVLQQKEMAEKYRSETVLSGWKRYEKWKERFGAKWEMDASKPFSWSIMRTGYNFDGKIYKIYFMQNKIHIKDKVISKIDKRVKGSLTLGKQQTGFVSPRKRTNFFGKLEEKEILNK